MSFTKCVVLENQLGLILKQVLTARAEQRSNEKFPGEDEVPHDGQDQHVGLGVDGVDDRQAGRHQKNAQTSAVDVDKTNL